MQEVQKRRDELSDIIERNKEIAPLLSPLLEEMIFLEPKLDELKRYPFIRINPDKPWMQKTTPAAKQYKELLQQYVNVVKAVEKSLRSTEEDTSPLLEWLKGCSNVDNR